MELIEDLAGLAHADLHAGVVDPARLATGDMVAEKTRVFAHLPPSLDFRFGEVGGEQRVHQDVGQQAPQYHHDR